MKIDPIFILCSPRSGSTLLRVMLAGHPGLFSPPEIHLLSYKTMRDWNAALGPCPWGSCPKDNHDCDQRHGLQRALMELKQVDDKASQQIIDAMIDRDEPIPQVYEMLASLAAPRRLVDKSPSYSADGEVMERARRLFPGALYIYLYRHPYAVIESIARIESQSISKAELKWRTRNANILKFLEAIERNRQIHVAYETLVQDPEPVMHSLCSFLGIEFDSAMLNPYEGNRMIDGVRPGCRPPGDWNFQAYQRIDQTRADVWRGLDMPLTEETQSISRVLGYDIPVASGLALEK